MRTELFSLHLADAPDTLQRVLAVCHRKQCDVVGVSFHAADRHRGARLELSVQAGARATELASRLEGLVDVLSLSRGGGSSAVGRVDQGSGSEGAAGACTGGRTGRSRGMDGTVGEFGTGGDGADGTLGVMGLGAAGA